jgi:hypothetical protein
MSTSRRALQDKGRNDARSGLLLGKLGRSKQRPYCALLELQQQSIAVRRPAATSEGRARARRIYF